MTALTNRPSTALIVLDVQNGVVEEAHDRDNVVARNNRDSDADDDGTACEVSRCLAPGDLRQIHAT
jgi:hypothetical protein